ncbi:hypothetical protein AGOR_G00013580 [Albula goreensis]|uniref:Uncharacterized protein n=1 Tax=Albula goreensis TaxID=1534307 RepID=A0A8T3E8B9_9TELE|nr:hypothetical protein AGOR_G00013580 [Albula goreensis]
MGFRQLNEESSVIPYSIRWHPTNKTEEVGIGTPICGQVGEAILEVNTGIISLTSGSCYWLQVKPGLLAISVGEVDDQGDACIMESGVSAGLSTAAVVAIVCNLLVAVLIIVLFVVLYKACKVPSNQERAPVLAVGADQQKNSQKYLLTP